MKLSVVKAIALCTMAMALVFVGASAVSTANTGVAVCHDGPTNRLPVR